MYKNFFLKKLLPIKDLLVFIKSTLLYTFFKAIYVKYELPDLGPINNIFIIKYD